MTELELLEIFWKARGIVADPVQWTGRHCAADEAGHWVPVGSARATRFDLSGALMKSAGVRAREVVGQFSQLISERFPKLRARMSDPSHPLNRQEAFDLLEHAIGELRHRMRDSQRRHAGA